MPVNEAQQRFLDCLGDRSSTDAPASTIRIQMGRETVFKGVLGQEPETNKLTDSRITVLNAALDSRPTATAQDQVKETSTAKGSINIDRDGDRVFRYARGVIEINRLSEPQQQAVEQVEPVAQAIEQVEPVAQVVEQVEPVAQAVEQVEPHAIQENISKFLLGKKQGGVAGISAITQHCQQTGLQINTGDVLKNLLEMESAGALKLDRKPTAKGTRIQVGQTNPAALKTYLDTEQPATAVTATEAIRSSPRQAIAQTVKDKLPAMAIAAIELHDNLKEPTREWLVDRFQDIKQSAIVQDLQAQGPTKVRSALKKIAKLPEATKNKALVDSVALLTKEFGGIQEVDGKKQWVYQAENYTVRLKGTNFYEVSPKDSNEIVLSFKHSATSSKVIENKLSLSEQFDVIRGGQNLAQLKAVTLARQTTARVQAGIESLGRLAPEGTHEKLEQIRTAQLATLAGMAVKGKEAVRSVVGSTLKGENYQIFESKAGLLQIFSRDGRGEVLRQSPDGQISTRMPNRELQRVSEGMQVLAQRIQTMGNQLATAGNKSQGKKDSGR